MSNAIKYHFEDFTHGMYRNLLQTAKKNYNFYDYKSFEKDQPFLLWRHDVDFSLHNALELARIEYEEGVKATYFILLHSEYYHPLEREAFSMIKEIISLGHDIGLHFDAHFYGITKEDELEKWIQFEKNIWEELLERQIHVFSFHNTSPFILSCQQEKYAGLINTYQEFFQKKADYCSDSFGIWRYKRLMDVLQTAENPQLQVLTHPEWWTEKTLSPKDRIWRTIQGRARANEKLYMDYIERNGLIIIDWHDK